MPTLRSRAIVTAAAAEGHEADGSGSGSCASSKIHISVSSPAHASNAAPGAVPEPLPVPDPITPAVERELSLSLSLALEETGATVQPLRRSTRRQAASLTSGVGKRKVPERKLEFADGDADDGVENVELEGPQQRRRRVTKAAGVVGTEAGIAGESAMTRAVNKGKRKVEGNVEMAFFVDTGTKNVEGDPSVVDEGKKKAEKRSSRPGNHQKALKIGRKEEATLKVSEMTRPRSAMDKGKTKAEEVIEVSDDENVIFIDEEISEETAWGSRNNIGEGGSSANLMGIGEGSRSGSGLLTAPFDLSDEEKADDGGPDIEYFSPASVVYGRRRPAKAAKLDPRTRNREIARKRAAHFAHFSPFDGDKVSAATIPDVPEVSVVDEALKRSLDEQKSKVTELLARVASGPEPREVEEAGNWPGPFSTARQLVEARQAAVAARQESTFAAAAKKSPSVEWEPSRPPNFTRGVRLAPSLYDLSMSILCANIEHVVDLSGIEEADKKSIAIRLCARRKMSPTVLGLYFQSRPTDVRIPDCSYITEDNLTEAFREGTENFEALELGMCGRCLSDKLCSLIWGQDEKLMPLLHTLSLKGAYNITDAGLNILARASPSLKTVNLIKCNMISPSGIETIADSVGPQLETFHLCDCSQLDASRVLPSLQKMTSVQSLSLSGIAGLTDDIVIQLVAALGSQLLEFSVGSCKALSDAAVCAISLNCQKLTLLDLKCIPNLTDASIAVLTESSCTLKTLKLNRGKFSEKAVTAFVTSCGSQLSDFSLNSVRQVGDFTLAALAKYSRGTLKKLDLSFCRGVTDKGLGLLADSSIYLRELRLFGCTQVTGTFLEGHSNSELDVIGLEKVLSQRY